MIEVGKEFSINCHTALARCKLIALESKIDKRTGRKVEDNPVSLTVHEAGMVLFEPLEPFSIEAFSTYSTLGRLVIRDNDGMLVVGVVKAINK